MEDTQQNALAIVQSRLRVPKARFNKAGGFHFRNVEDILEAAKQVAGELGFFITLSDEVVAIGNRIYIQSTAEMGSDNETFSAVGFAREDEVSVKLSGPQMTGASSSYARKYALCGLFAIDDSEDADTTEQPTVDVDILRGELRTLIVSVGQKVAKEKLAGKFTEFGLSGLSAVPNIEDPKVLQALIQAMKPEATGSV